MTLPPGYSIRRPALADAEAVAALMTAAEADEGFTADDVRHEWHHFDLDNDVWLIESRGAAVGTAGLLKRPDGAIACEAYVDPEERGRGLLTLIEERARERAPGGVLRNGVLAANAAAITLLEQRGYRPVRHFFRMVIELREPPPEPRWPAGLELRPFDRAHAEAFHDATQEAFAEEWGHARRTFEDFLHNRLEAPGASPGLWLGVWDGDELAATLTCDERRNEMGWIASLGVRKPWRNRGLGLALLHHAFGEFWRRGQRRIGLGVDAENRFGATRLYERAGMNVLTDYVVYEKRLGV
jgi:mycothiol synthase